MKKIVKNVMIPGNTDARNMLNLKLDDDNFIIKEYVWSNKYIQIYAIDNKIFKTIINPHLCPIQSAINPNIRVNIAATTKNIGNKSDDATYRKLLCFEYNSFAALSYSK